MSKIHTFSKEVLVIHIAPAGSTQENNTLRRTAWPEELPGQKNCQARRTAGPKELPAQKNCRPKRTMVCSYLVSPLVFKLLGR